MAAEIIVMTFVNVVITKAPLQNEGSQKPISDE